MNIGVAMDNKIEINSSDEINEEEFKRFKKITQEIRKQELKDKYKKKLTPIFNKLKIILKAISAIIIWICGVGCFVIALIQLFKNI